MEDIFQGSHDLGGTVSRRGRGIDLHAVEEVVAHDELGPAARIGSGQRIERDHVTRCIPYIELAEIFCPGPVVAFGHNIYLPLQAEAVEEVNQRAAHERLHCLVQVRQLDLLGHRFGVVHLYPDLGNAEQGCGEEPRQLRAFACFRHIDLCLLREKVNGAARAVFKNESSAS